MIAGLLDHLWQSTLFAGGAGLLTLALPKNPARLRFRLWFAASLKFLVPFAALSALGESLSRRFPTAVPRLMLEIRPAAERLSAPAQVLAPHQHVGGIDLVPLLSGLWFAGFGVVIAMRAVRWLRLRAVMRRARAVDIAAPLDVKASASLLEPGLVGILRPVVLLPEGLMARLSKAERDAILAHELSHFSSGDNITAAIHMLVEALFWFWPPVWLIGARLIAERERACDESVLAEGHDAEVYAQGILKVCRFCVQSPLACAAGASGADLGRRVRQIMSDETVSDPGPVQKTLLVTATALALAFPVAEGFVSSPPLLAEVQRQVAAVKFQVATRIAQAATQMQRTAAAPPAKARHLSRRKAALSPSRRERRMAAAEPVPAPVPPGPSVAEIAPPSAPVTPPPASARPAPAVPAAAVSMPAHTAVKEVLTALYPEGTGDPDGVTCRLPEALPGSHLPGPRICWTNRQWAMLRAQRADITPDGESIILRNGSEIHAGYVVLNCAGDRVTTTGVAENISTPASVCF